MPPDFTPELLDKLASRARKVVGQDADRVPDKSAVRNLVEFARSTPSVEELTLFIDYQGGRASNVHKDFYRNVTRDVRELTANDIEVARRFLALVVRAAVVVKSNPGSQANPKPQQKGSGGKERR
jgi:hypothetical protein